MQTSGSSANWRSRLVGGVRAPMVWSGVEARLAGMPGQGTAPSQPGRGLAQGVAALSPRRESVPAASAQAPGLTPTPSSGSRPEEGQFRHRSRSCSRGCDAEAGAEEARLARLRLPIHRSQWEPGAAAHAPCPAPARPLFPQAGASLGLPAGWTQGLLTLVAARWPPSLPWACSLAC